MVSGNARSVRFASEICRRCSSRRRSRDAFQGRAQRQRLREGTRWWPAAEIKRLARWNGIVEPGMSARRLGPRRRVRVDEPSVSSRRDDSYILPRNSGALACHGVTQGAALFTMVSRSVRRRRFLRCVDAEAAAAPRRGWFAVGTLFNGRAHAASRPNARGALVGSRRSTRVRI